MKYPEVQGRLARVVGVPGAVLMGLGSILGTGTFVSIGIAARVVGRRRSHHGDARRFAQLAPWVVEGAIGDVSPR